MAAERFQYLLSVWSNGSISVAEEKELFEWVLQHNEATAVHAHVQQLLDQYKENELLPAVDYDALFLKILEQRTAETKPVVHITERTSFGWWKYIAAACIIVLAGIAVYTSLKTSGKPGEKIITAQKTDIQPGGNKATLTLSNGTTINLDSIKGNIAKPGNTQQILNSNGVLNYNGNSTAVEFNTLATPRGGMYNLQLNDGTQVWLNAASSITFPTAFTGNERNVSITGEVYFEVARDKTKPFHVKVNDMMVEVLGTHFNINSYADEAAIKTTLLEGSVRVTNNNSNSIIKPGEQAVADATNKSIVILPVETSEVMAWKNGSFIFNDAPLEEVMKQIARWYNVDVVYPQGIPGIKIGGEMKRDLSLSQLLNGLGKIGVQFKIEHTQLTVLAAKNN